MQSNHAAISALINLRVDLIPLNKEKEKPCDIARRKNDQLSLRLLEAAMRERRIIGSTLKQRLKEDQDIAQRIIFCLPFMLLLLIVFTLDSSLNYFVKSSIVFTFMPIFVFLFRFFSSDCLDVGIRTLLFSFSTVSKIFVIFSWLIFIHPIVPWHMQIEFLLALVAVPILFYLVCTSDPGYISVTHKERCDMIVTMTEQSLWKNNFCPTCLITRPIRSKHCSVCDKCVILFDHHCPWMNNCIGGKNNKIFVLYLMAMNFSVFLVFLGCFFYWRSVCGQMNFAELISCKPWVLILQIMCLFYTFFLGVMNCMHFYQILTATTTNERMNMYRYSHFHTGGVAKNPFTQGCASNVYSFWCHSAEDAAPLNG